MDGRDRGNRGTNEDAHLEMLDGLRYNAFFSLESCIGDKWSQQHLCQMVGTQGQTTRVGTLELWWGPETLDSTKFGSSKLRRIGN